MKCGLCGKTNDPGNRFCIHCGAPLQPLSEQLEEIRAELGRLSRSLASMNDRLSALERDEGAPETLSPESHEATVEPEVALPTQVSSSILPADEIPIQPTKEPSVVAAETGFPGLAPQPDAAKHKPAKHREWEQILGGNWLARIGVVALIVGVAFFLKFAFDNNWLGPVARVVLGGVFGLAMMAAAQFWQKKYPVFAQAIGGGGIAVLYLSIFAAYITFHLVGPLPALLLVLLTSVAAAFLAVRTNSMALAILGIVGALIAPALLGVAAPNDKLEVARYGAQLLPYVLVVDIGVLILSAFRNWRWFTLLALSGSLIFFIEWNALAGERLGLLAAEGGLTSIFLVFVAATTLFHILWRRPVRATDYALAAANATFYFGLSYLVMWNEARAWLGGFSLLLALFYGGLAYAAFKRDSEKTLALCTLGIAIVVFTIAIPVQLGDASWTVIAWAAQAAVLVWLSLRTRLAHFRIYAYGAFGLVAFRLLFYDAWVRQPTPVFNERMLAFTAGAAAMAAASYMIWRWRPAHWQAIHSVFVIASDILLLVTIGAELGDYSSARLHSIADSISLVLLGLTAALMSLHYAFWRRELKVTDIVLLMLNAAVLGSLSALLWGHLRPWVGAVYLALAAFHGLLVYRLVRRREQNRPVIHFAMAIAFVFLILAIPVQFEDQVWTTLAALLLAAGLLWLYQRTRIADLRIYTGISVGFLTITVPMHFGNQPWTTMFWAGELAVLMWASFAARMSELRVYGYVLFVLTAGQLVVFRTAIPVSEYRPILNGRFLVYAAGIVASYLAAYILYRNRKAYPEWSIPGSTLLIGANLLTIWLFSFEVWNYFDKQQAAAITAQGKSAQQLSLTAVWAVYAVALLVIGIAKRWRQVRWWGMGLLALTIIKVFVYDVFALEQVYRIVAFVGLGILLLASGYLYQRYSKAIRGFILSK